MRVLITGATGFLGSAIARLCVTAEMEVSAIRRTGSNLARLDGVAERIAFFDNTDAGIAAALDHPYDAVVHAATCYGRQGESWPTLLETNTLFPLRILEKVVGRDPFVFVNIDTVLDAHTNAYAMSKRQFADWGRMAVKLGGFRLANVRLEHLYGPNDDPSRFVPQIIHQCLANAESIPLTEGHQLRDFIHIDDAAAGILRLLGVSETLPSGWSEFDLGSGLPVSIRQLVEHIHRLTNSQAKLCFGAKPYRVGEMMASTADISKLVELGWACRVSLDVGLAQTIDFERAMYPASSGAH